MFDMMSLFVSKAFAQEMAAPAATAQAALPPPSGGDTLMRFLPLALIFLVFYFLLIRPQQKKAQQHEAMMQSLKKGDKVVTTSGMIGTIVKTDDETTVTVEIAKDVQIKVLRSGISHLVDDLSKAKPSK